MLEVLNYPAVSGVQLRRGRRQSIPSGSIASWAAVRAILPSLADGQTKRPCSKRLLNRHAPRCPAAHACMRERGAVPPDDLDHIAAPATKDEQVAGEGILLERRLGLGRQRREAPAHVRDPCRQPDPRVRRNRDHADKPRISRANALGS